MLVSNTNLITENAALENEVQDLRMRTNAQKVEISELRKKKKMDLQELTRISKECLSQKVQIERQVKTIQILEKTQAGLKETHNLMAAVLETSEVGTETELSEFLVSPMKSESCYQAEIGTQTESIDIPPEDEDSVLGEGISPIPTQSPKI